MTALRLLPILAVALFLDGCVSTVGDYKMPWARDCADRPTALGKHLACKLGGEFEIVESTRHPCTDSGGLFGDARRRQMVDEYNLKVARKESDEIFARVRIEESVPAQYSNHKWSMMDNLHTMSSSTVPGKEVNGVPTFWVDEKAAAAGDVETFRVLYFDDERTIVTIYFLRSEKGEGSKDAQDAFVDAYTRCLRK